MRLVSGYGPSMHGTIGKDGLVTITFNLGAGERLTTLWTDETTGRPRLSQYLLCDGCEEHKQAGCDLVDCENPWHPDHEARRAARLRRCEPRPGEQRA